MISWIHFGDLHISGKEEQNYRDFVQLIDEANRYLAAGIGFALLPGDNADDGEEDQYELVRFALARSRFTVHAISGDHDVAAGNLDLFRRHLSDPPYRSFTLDACHFVLLNSVAQWRPPDFGLGAEQMAWLQADLKGAVRNDESIVVFLHAYPSEHGSDANALRDLFFKSGVGLVEMGHTHYNELANDGRTIYAATRSTGQVEEGPPGFSITTIDQGVVSWKFKPMGDWPLVMISSPSDERLIVDPSSAAQVVRGSVTVRARVWGEGIETVVMSLDEGDSARMARLDECTWGGEWDSTGTVDGPRAIQVTAQTRNGQRARDRIIVCVNQRGIYEVPSRHAVDYENVIGEWPEKHILGTQLGPNENGRHWPSRRQQAAIAR
jgi:hypothetical protein